ncbi:MAG TPA: hypothetical protein PK507_02020 [bacterium]|nr:hypothetical protein [bacterium]
MNNLLLKSKRSKTEVWRADDVKRFFELTDDTTVLDNFTNKNFNEKIEKYQQFIIEPKSRFMPGCDNKLKNHDDVIYFALYGIDNTTDERFVKFDFCGYAIGNSQILRNLK